MRILLLISLVSLFFYGCSSPAGVTEPGLTFKIHGTVELLDSNCLPIADRSGVYVEVLDTYYSAYTNKDGYWEIPNYPVSYSGTLKFSKKDFCWIELWMYLWKSISDSTYSPPNITIGQPPKFAITLDGFILPSDQSAGQLYSHVSVDYPDSIGIGQYFIIGRKSTLRIEDTSSYFMTFTDFYAQDTGSLSRNLTTIFAYRGEVLPTTTIGETLYVRAYPFFTNSGYQLSGRELHTNGYGKNGSNVLSGVVQ